MKALFEILSVSLKIVFHFSLKVSVASISFHPKFQCVLRNIILNQNLPLNRVHLYYFMIFVNKLLHIVLFHKGVRHLVKGLNHFVSQCGVCENALHCLFLFYICISFNILF